VRAGIFLGFLCDGFLKFRSHLATQRHLLEHSHGIDHAAQRISQQEVIIRFSIVEADGFLGFVGSLCEVAECVENFAQQEVWLGVLWICGDGLLQQCLRLIG